MNKHIEKMLKYYDEMIKLPMPIEWRSVVGFTKYDVSNHGHIRNTWTNK